MTIRQRGKNWQVDVAVDGQRWRGTAETQREAVLLEAQVRLDLLAGKPVASPGREIKTLGALREEVIRRHWRGTKGEKTAVLNSGAAIAFFGPNESIAAITTEHIDHYIEWLGALGNSNGTINRKLAALSKMLRFAHQRGWLDAMPYIPRKRESEGRLRWLTDQEYSRLVAAAARREDFALADLMMFLVDTGCRLGEALRLEWADVDGNRVYLWDTKSGKARSVPLTDRAKGILGRRHGAGEDRPFDLNKRDVQRRFAEAKYDAGLGHDETIVLHTLRHTFASRLVQCGVPIQTVSKLLGHSSLQMTMRYALLADANMDEAVAILNG